MENSLEVQQVKALFHIANGIRVLSLVIIACTISIIVFG